MKILIFCVLLSALFVPINAEENLAFKPTNVDDPIGLGERLALIDYFQELKIPLRANETLEDLRVRFWTLHAQEQQRVDLYRELRDEFKLNNIEENMSYESLWSRKVEALRKREIAAEQSVAKNDTEALSKREQLRDQIEKVEDNVASRMANSTVSETEDQVAESNSEPKVASKTESQTIVVTWPPVLSEKMPNISLFDLMGNKVQLHSVSKGKPVLLDYVGMTCSGCNAFLGANDKAIGPYKGQSGQAGLESIATYLPMYANGLKLDDRRFTYVVILFYGLDLKAPTLKDALAFAQHYQLTDKPNHVVLFGDASFIKPETYKMIPGFQLVDKNWTLISDSTGHHPRHKYWDHTFPELHKLIK